MRCHYEILGVPPESMQDDIKRAYRRLVLVHHPDKHGEDTRQQATEQFRLLQQAYEVLSDEQERAWYDGHRTQILKSDDPNAPGSPADANYEPRNDGDLVDVMAYFSSSVWSGMDDSARGFFTIYRNVFDALREQEMYFHEEYMARKGTDDDEQEPHVAIPWTTFGSSDTKDLAQLTSFYSYWTHFATFVRFEWCDQFAPHNASNRRVRRSMEKENKRLRSVARKEYNESVRALALYAQKRDLRYKRLVDEMKAAKETKAALLAANKSREKAQQDAELASNFQEKDWMKVPDSPVLSHLSDASDDARSDGDSKSVDSEEGVYCVVCSKGFRSEQQFNNHEKSKKHLKAAHVLRKKMLKEERLYKDSREVSDESADTDESDDVFVDAQENLDDYNQSQEFPDDEVLPENTFEDDERPVKSSPGVKSVTNDEDEDDYDKDILERLRNLKADAKKIHDAEEPQEHSETPAIDESVESSKPAHPSKKKKQPKKKSSQCNTTEDGAHQCNVCSESFASRNQLFTHIKTEGHAQVAEKLSTGKKGKRRK